MTKEHRRELYSPTPPDALQVPDAVGPDGVRVTLRVEPAVAPLMRWRFLFSNPFPDMVIDPIGTYAEYRVLPRLVQRHLLRDAWVVDVEADSGEKTRVKASDREQAIGYARRIHAGIEQDGVCFLRTFAS